MKPYLLIFTFFLVLLILNTLSFSDKKNKYTVIIDYNTKFLLGGIVNHKWVKGENFTFPIKEGASYKLYGLQKLYGKGIGKDVEGFGQPCEEQKLVKVKAKINSQIITDNMIAINSNWNALPRKPQVLNKNSDIYQGEVLKLLKELGLENPKINIRSILKVDLDEDKTDEILIHAENFKGNLYEIADKDNYSIVFLRKLYKGKVHNIILSSSIFTKKTNEVIHFQHKLLNILDLNGDGTMEIILSSEYYEGHSIEVYKIKGVKADFVIGAGCGA